MQARSRAKLSREATDVESLASVPVSVGPGSPGSARSLVLHLDSMPAHALPFVDEGAGDHHHHDDDGGDSISDEEEEDIKALCVRAPDSVIGRVFVTIHGIGRTRAAALTDVLRETLADHAGPKVDFTVVEAWRVHGGVEVHVLPIGLSQADVNRRLCHERVGRALEFALAGEGGMQEAGELHGIAEGARWVAVRPLSRAALVYAHVQGITSKPLRNADYLLFKRALLCALEGGAVRTTYPQIVVNDLTMVDDNAYLVASVCVHLSAGEDPVQVTQSLTKEAEDRFAARLREDVPTVRAVKVDPGKPFWWDDAVAMPEEDPEVQQQQKRRQQQERLEEYNFELAALHSVNLEQRSRLHKMRHNLAALSALQAIIARDLELHARLAVGFARWRALAQESLRARDQRAAALHAAMFKLQSVGLLSLDLVGNDGTAKKRWALMLWRFVSRQEAGSEDRAAKAAGLAVAALESVDLAAVRDRFLSWLAVARRRADDAQAKDRAVVLLGRLLGNAEVRAKAGALLAWRGWAVHEAAREERQRALQGKVVRLLGASTHALQRGGFQQWRAFAARASKAEERGRADAARLEESLAELLLGERARLLRDAMTRWHSAVVSRQSAAEVGRVAAARMVDVATGLERAAVLEAFLRWRRRTVEEARAAQRQQRSASLLEHLVAQKARLGLRRAFDSWRHHNAQQERLEIVLLRVANALGHHHHHHPHHDAGGEDVGATSASLQQRAFSRWRVRAREPVRDEGLRARQAAAVSRALAVVARKRLRAAFRSWRGGGHASDERSAESRALQLVLQHAAVRALRTAFKHWHQLGRQGFLQGVREGRRRLANTSNPSKELEVARANIATHLDALEAMAEARRARRLRYL